MSWVCLVLGMHLLVTAAVFIQLTTFIPSYVTALHGNCSVDAIVSYVGNDKLYFFKGSKYGRWNDDNFTIECVKGRLWLCESCIDNLLLSFCQKKMLFSGHSRMTSPGERKGYLKLVTKNWHRKEGVHANSDITTKKKLCISFYVSAVFDQRGSSWALGSILVMVSCQALAWVRASQIKPDLHLGKSACFGLMLLTYRWILW